MNLLRILFLFVFLHCPGLSFSQAQEDLIDPENIDSYYLEHLIKKKIDSIRLSKGLMELVNDSILYIASAHHSAVQAKKKDTESLRSPFKIQESAKTGGGLWRHQLLYR